MIHINITAMFYADSTFGITQAPWDVQWTPLKFDKILKQFSASNLSETCVACIWVNPLQLLDMTNILAANEYGEPVNMYWHKPQHHTPTCVGSYTSSVEQLVAGFKPNRLKCPFNVSRDPRQRHNFMSVPSVTKYVRDDHGEIVNGCQKPPDLSRKMANTHCMPGDWVMNVGPGAGGCLLGLIQAGCHVVCIESDEKQFQILEGTVWKWAENGDYEYDASVEDDDGEDQPDVYDDMEEGSQKGESSSLNATGDSKSDSTAQQSVTVEEVVFDTCAQCNEKFVDSDVPVNCKSGSCGKDDWYHKNCTSNAKMGGFDVPWSSSCVDNGLFGEQEEVDI